MYSYTYEHMHMECVTKPLLALLPPSLPIKLRRHLMVLSAARQPLMYQPKPLIVTLHSLCGFLHRRFFRTEVAGLERRRS